MDSILTSIKKMLGIDESETQFDQELIIFINSAFSVLLQLGVGPVDGFRIEDDSAEWVEFLGTRTDIENVKTYIYLKVRLIFDPPSSSFVLEAINKQITESEWRLTNSIIIPTVDEGGEDCG